MTGFSNRTPTLDLFMPQHQQAILEVVHELQMLPNGVGYLANAAEIIAKAISAATVARAAQVTVLNDAITQYVSNPDRTTADLTLALRDAHQYNTPEAWAAFVRNPELVRAIMPRMTLRQQEENRVQLTLCQRRQDELLAHDAEHKQHIAKLARWCAGDDLPERDDPHEDLGYQPRKK